MQYKTPLRHIQTANEKYGLGIGFPFEESDTLKFTQYLLLESNPELKKKTVEPTTVRNYLSGVRAAHLSRGLAPPKLLTPLVGMLRRGQENFLKQSWDREEIPP